jgi:hypothetical protein
MVSTVRSAAIFSATARTTNWLIEALGRHPLHPHAIAIHARRLGQLDIRAGPLAEDTSLGAPRPFKAIEHFRVLEEHSELT